MAAIHRRRRAARSSHHAGEQLASELLAEMRARRITLAMVARIRAVLPRASDAGRSHRAARRGEFMTNSTSSKARSLSAPARKAAAIFDGAFGLRDLEMQYNILLPEDPAYATLSRSAMAQSGFICVVEMLRLRRLSLHRAGNGSSPRPRVKLQRIFRRPALPAKPSTPVAASVGRQMISPSLRCHWGGRYPRPVCAFALKLRPEQVARTAA